MKWRRLANALLHGLCAKCGIWHDKRNALEIQRAKGFTNLRAYCDACMAKLPESEGDPRL